MLCAFAVLLLEQGLGANDHRYQPIINKVILFVTAVKD
jgi:hypothetical protein